MLIGLYSPERHLRREVPGQLRLHQSERSADARAGHRQRAGVRRGPVCHAPLGEAGPVGEAGNHRARNRHRDSGAEHRQSRRAGWRRARAEGPGIHLLGPRAGPADFARGVRADRRARDSGWRDRARQGRGARRTGLAGLQRHRPAQWKAERRHRRLSVARAPTPCEAAAGVKKLHGGSSRSASRRTWITRSRSTPRAP